jgi:hypothetical protein
MPKQLLFTLCCTVISVAACAQDSATESRIIKEAQDNAVASYYKFTDKRARLYNGVEHVGYLYTIKGFAYYLTDQWVKGSVVYDGLAFEQVPMMYDAYRDKVIVLHFNGYRLTLLSEKVTGFDLHGHHFVRHSYDSLAKSSLPTGFYDYLYQGKKTTVLARRLKLLDEKLTDRVEQEFLPSTNYTIYKDSIYHSCNSRRALLHTFGNRMKDVRRYLRKNKIKYKQDRENTIIQAAKYYDTLN